MPTKMHLSDHDLRQIDENYLKSLSLEELLVIAMRAVEDLKEARDRLNQNPTNSSRPPSSCAPWVTLKFKEEENEEKEESDSIEITSDLEESESIDDNADKSHNESCEDKKDSKKEEPNYKGCDGTNDQQKLHTLFSNWLKAKGNILYMCCDTFLFLQGLWGPHRKAGKQKGAKGYGRTVKLPVTDTIIHRAEECAACGCHQGEDSEFKARGGYYVVDIEMGDESNPGIRVTNTKHIYGDTTCACGHVTRTVPHRCKADPEWKVELTEWHLVGPMLMALICCLKMRNKMSRRRIREFLIDWLCLPLSIGTINQCIHESGRAASPVVNEQLLEEVNNSGLLHADETSWKEKGHALYLWVLLTTTVTLYVIGSRSRKTLESVLKLTFAGWLMSDGYLVYRKYKNRLRCWAHLLRKARGLFESLDREAQGFGKEVLDILDILMAAVYKVREGPSENLSEKYRELLEQFRACCKKYRDSKHEKTRALAREFLNDWDAIFCVLAHPELPLTNNEAEQALRQWVILRKVLYGSRTSQGSRVFAVLASIIDTCRKRNISPWKYLATVISERRKGNEAPWIPAAA